MSNAQLTEGNRGSDLEQQSDAITKTRNAFRQILPDAVQELKRILKMSTSERLKADVAEMVIEHSGAGGQPKTGQVVINDSQVQLLVQVAREVGG